jgi:hypothetical protein
MPSDRVLPSRGDAGVRHKTGVPPGGVRRTASAFVADIRAPHSDLRNAAS